jgi:hypothetical protein
MHLVPGNPVPADLKVGQTLDWYLIYARLTFNGSTMPRLISVSPLR